MFGKFFKQLFCSHIWKQTSEWEKLRDSREADASLPGMGVQYHNYTYKSANFQCLKCDKKKL